MYRDFRVHRLTTLTVFLFLLLAAGCGEEPAEQETTEAGTVTVEIAEQPPVIGWLDVVMPSEAVSMDAFGENLWILTSEGIVMRWNTADAEWSAVESDIPLESTDFAFEITASENGSAVLSESSVVIFTGDEVSEFAFEDGCDPEALCSFENNAIAVLFSDGSVSLVSETAIEMLQIVEPAEKTVTGSFTQEENILAWLNTDGTMSRFDVTESLLTEMTVPENATDITLEDGELFASDGSFVYRANTDGEWVEHCNGSITGDNLIYTDLGIASLSSVDPVTAGLPGEPVKTCQLEDGTIWSITSGGVAVWAELGCVETRLPDADVQMIRYRMAGQTGGGSANGSGIAASDASFGGVFRIYESVSSRPDPFSEFPLSSRDLRRPLEVLTIEELHLVGITIDPSGGDQAMVEDANGVAYVLNEGTVLRNNTHIAEITGNEVIVVQEVTVGTEDTPGGTTSIPTIFSMRLHEEGGL